MSSFLTSPYRFKVQASFDFKPEFLKYLKDSFKEILNYKISSYQQMGVPILEREYVFNVTDLPFEYVKIRSMPDAKMLAEFQDSEGVVVPKMVKDLVDELQKLDPLTEEEPLTLKFTLRDIINEVVSKLSFFSESHVGSVEHYFGIMTNVWYTSTPILLEDVMKAVDYGNLDYDALNLFNFVFESFRVNFDLLFEDFIKKMEESNNADDKEL